MATKKPSNGVAVNPMESLMLPSGLVVPKSASSPFPDGYDIEAETSNLAELIDADEPDTAHPLYGRYLELIDRAERLRSMKQESEARNHADKFVPSGEAAGMNRLGGLVPDEQATMILHTREAYRLFIGRAADVSQNVRGEVSVKKAAAMLRVIWSLSSNDNPYADWALLVTSERIGAAHTTIERHIGAKEKIIDGLKKRGMTLHVLKSKAPVTVDLGFVSPYGFMLAALILDYDYMVRVVKTLVNTARLTDAEGREVIYTGGRQIRSMLERIVPVHRALGDERMSSLSRADWVPNADDLAQKRVHAATALFKPLLGELPRDVFVGSRAPAYSKRRVSLTQDELHFLESVPLDGGYVDGSAAEGALV